jgi:hypothetical protein
MTLTFISGDATGKNNPVNKDDVIRNNGTQVFTSDADNSQTESVSASANK